MLRFLGGLLLFFGLASAASAQELPARPLHYTPRDLILILGAVPQEVPPFVEAMTDAKRKRLSGIDYWQGHIGGKAVAVALTGVGKVKASTVTTLFVTALRPRLVLMSGTGSRPDPALRAGDLIVATELYEHDAGSLTRNDMVYRDGLEPIRPPATLLAAADRAIASYARPTVTANGATYEIAVRRGVVVTSDLFGVTDARIATLRSRFHADIMEMESFAFTRSCAMLGVPCLVVRAGSNVSQEAPGDDYKRLGPIAAKQAALFGVWLLKFM